jgi:molybdate transport system substrate-binding protein
MKKTILFFLMFLMTVNAFSRKTVIQVAAAANLSFPMAALIENFQKTNPDIEVAVSYGSSGKFATQILEGAPFDLFLSADTGFPQKILENGMAYGDPAVYASGRLALFSLIPRDFKKGIRILLGNDIRTISIANPGTAPYGKVSEDALKNARIYIQVKDKIAHAESIAQVTQQVMAAADIGFIAKSAIYSKDLEKYNREEVHWIDVDPGLYQPIEQAMVILNAARNKDAVKKFYDFILSPAAKEIFRKYGYVAN